MALLFGDNGLFKKSQEAVEKYKEAEKKESDEISAFIDSWSVSEFSKQITGEEETPTTITVAGQEVVIPPKFTIAKDSGATVDNGIVVEDKSGNQWVWIPCYVEGGKKTSNAVAFDRYAFFKEDWEEKQTKLEEKDEDGSYKILLEQVGEEYWCHEQLENEEYESIKKYGGYYIGRYEAGDKESTEAGQMRGEGSSTISTNRDDGDNSHTVVIRKNQTPYNYVKIDQCMALAEGIAEQYSYGDKLFTKLCSSYAWDTALKFIDQKYKNYSINSVQGNYSGALMKTGLTVPVCNIYDMGGNLFEYSSEHCGAVWVPRGGGFGAERRPASTRHSTLAKSYVNCGFRPVLYIK